MSVQEQNLPTLPESISQPHHQDLENNPFPTCVFSPDGQILAHNLRYAPESQPQSLVGQSYFDTVVTPDRIRQAVSTLSPDNNNLVNLTIVDESDGKLRYYQYSLLGKFTANGLESVLSSRIDITDTINTVRESRQETVESRFKDPLTGLYVRDFALEELKRLALAVKNGRLKDPVALLMLDINDFKLKINDKHGHGAGDLAIQKAAQIIINSIRGTDLASRYGGDEFLIVLSNIKEEEVTLLIERIRQNSELASLDNRNNNIPFDISFSIGRAQLDPDNIQQTIEDADAQMYIEKAAHKAADKRKRYQNRIQQGLAYKRPRK